MNRVSTGTAPRLCATMLIVSNLGFSSGCATLLRGTSQTVTVKTRPVGCTVIYDGLHVSDGEAVTVRKGFTTPKFDVGEYSGTATVDMKYHPDPWLLGDAALLFAGVIPGVIALGVDFGTGTWRHLEEEQMVHAPGPLVTPAAMRRSPW